MGAQQAGGEGLDELRRRLYAPDATEADRAAFAAAEAAAAEAPPPLPAPEPDEGAAAAVAVRSPPGRRRVAGIGGATALVVVLAVAVAVGHPFAPRPVTATATPDPATSVIGSIPVPDATRSAFLLALGAGRDPQLLRYLDAHPAAFLDTLQADGRADRATFAGTGPTTLTLRPSAAAARAGHVTLVLLTDRSVHFEWVATVVAESNDRSGPDAPVATDDGAAVAGEPVSGTVDYSGGVPSGLTLLLPAGVRWSAVVIVTR